MSRRCPRTTVRSNHRRAPESSTTRYNPLPSAYRAGPLRFRTCTAVKAFTGCRRLPAAILMPHLLPHKNVGCHGIDVDDVIQPPSLNPLRNGHSRLHLHNRGRYPGGLSLRHDFPTPLISKVSTPGDLLRLVRIASSRSRYADRRSTKMEKSAAKAISRASGPARRSAGCAQNPIAPCSARALMLSPKTIFVCARRIACPSTVPLPGHQRQRSGPIGYAPGWANVVAPLTTANREAASLHLYN